MKTHDELKTAFPVEMERFEAPGAYWALLHLAPSRVCYGGSSTGENDQIKSQRITAFGICVTIVGASLEAREQEWCKPACGWIADQPHVPHDSHDPMPTRPALEFLTSGSSSASVPFIPYDGSAADTVIRLHHQRRVAQTMIASMSTSTFKME